MSNFVNLLDIIYPVGSVYITATENSPANSIGGTWAEIKDRVLLDRTNANCLTVGGNMTHNHLLDNNSGAMLDILPEGSWVNMMHYHTNNDDLSFTANILPSMKKTAIRVSEVSTANPSTRIFYPLALTGHTVTDTTYPAYFCVRIYRRTA